MNLKEKKETLKNLVAEAKSLQGEMSADEAKKTSENVANLDAKLAEIKSLKAEVESGEAIEGAESFLSQPAEAKSGYYIPAKVESRAPRSIGQSFVEAEAYKSASSRGRGQGTNVRVEIPDFNPALKTTFTTSGAGVTAGMGYLPGIVELGQQPLTVANLIARGTTNLGAVPYIVESSFTNGAATVAEGGTKPEAAFATEEKIAPVKKIAVVGRVSDELFADYPSMQSYVDGRLRYMVGAKEEDQILNGNGSGSNITGILNTSGVQFQNLTGNSLQDAIHKAITKIRSGAFVEPDAVVINPTDWETLRLAKDDNNQYYAGGPFTPMAGSQIWGLPVVVTSSIAAGTTLVGAFRIGAQAFYKAGLTVEATNSDGDDFSNNLMAIRVEERLALAVFRPSAFCSIYED